MRDNDLKTSSMLFFLNGDIIILELKHLKRSTYKKEIAQMSSSILLLLLELLNRCFLYFVTLLLVM